VESEYVASQLNAVSNSDNGGEVEHASTEVRAGAPRMIGQWQQVEHASTEVGAEAPRMIGPPDIHREGSGSGSGDDFSIRRLLSSTMSATQEIYEQVVVRKANASFHRESGEETEAQGRWGASASAGCSATHAGAGPSNTHEDNEDNEDNEDDEDMSDGDDEEDGLGYGPEGSPLYDLPAHPRTSITHEEIASCFHLSAKDASMHLGIGLTFFQSQCRKVGIVGWPFRKMKAIDRLISKLPGGENAIKRIQNKRSRLAADLAGQPSSLGAFVAPSSTVEIEEEMATDVDGGG